MDPIVRTRELARRTFDGLATEAEFAELQQLLQSSAAAADAFAELSRLESALGELFAQQQGVRHEARVLVAIERQQIRRRWVGYGVRVAVAAVVLIALLGSLAWWSMQWPPSPKPDGPVRLAGLVEHVEGVVRVMSDEATLRLPDDSRVVLEKESEIVVPPALPGGPRVVELRHGAGRFTVADSDVAFQVETPVGRVTALGTEFSLALVDERGGRAMKGSRMILLVAVVAGLVQVEVTGVDLLSAGQSRAFAQERERNQERKPVGRAQRAMVVSAGDGKLTVMVAGDGGREEKTFTVGDKVTITLDGKPAKLDALTKSMMIVLEMGTKDGDGLVAIRGEGPTFAAVLKTVAKDKITIEGRGREGQAAEPVEYPLIDKAKITVEGKPGEVTDLKAGDRVSVMLSSNRKNIIAIVRARGGERDGERERAGRLGGVVKAIDLKASTITIPGGREGADQTYPLAKEVKVSQGERAAKLEDVKVGAAVGLVMDKDGKTVTAILLRGERERGDKRPGERERERDKIVFGKVKGAQTKDSTITLEGTREKPDERLFAVAKDAKITISGKDAKLEDVKEGMTVQMTLGRDGKTVTGITVGKREGERKRDGER